MKTTIQETEKQIVATLSGELDTAAAMEMENELKPLYDSKGREIVIDCSGLEYIASSGLRILLGILKNAKACGSRVVLKNVNDVIREVFELTGFVRIFDFE
ncbi:MAG: STAS domain-containing protein [Bacteroidales bacterium]|jgi:anti-anti-sigma factor|nr:STAS domain-containing protein [Bacteroidales bacterium]MBR6932808.1 STAS domain-containing protein [Bacteroidales bacterium]